jgi:hypothetical protein
MGSDTFRTRASGKTANDAFNNAVREAQYESGHGGYSGTIAEKNCFQMIDLPKGKDARDFANELISEGDPRIDDKWGPAGCIALGKGEYLFFGWASS